MQSTPNDKYIAIETILKAQLSPKKDDEICVMTQLIIDECPQNGKDLFDLLQNYLKDAESFNRGAKKLFTQVHKDLDKKKCIGKAKPKKVVTPKAQPKEEETESNGTPGFKFESSGRRRSSDEEVKGEEYDAARE